MSYRKCLVCNGTGMLWGTPKLTSEPSNTNQIDPKHEIRPRDEGTTNYGLSVQCWRCLGEGSYREQDDGASNG